MPVIEIFFLGVRERLTVRAPARHRPASGLAPANASRAAVKQRERRKVKIGGCRDLEDLMPVGRRTSEGRTVKRPGRARYWKTMIYDNGLFFLSSSLRTLCLPVACETSEGDRRSRTRRGNTRERNGKPERVENIHPLPRVYLRAFEAFGDWGVGVGVEGAAAGGRVNNVN